MNPPDPTGALQQLDPVLEHRVRLAICALLTRSAEITFSRFKAVLAQTDGSLGAQLRRLEDEGYLALRRDFVKRKPVTWYRLTAAGRKALQRHLAGLRTLLDV